MPKTLFGGAADVTPIATAGLRWGVAADGPRILGDASPESRGLPVSVVSDRPAAPARR